MTWMRPVLLTTCLVLGANGCTGPSTEDGPKTLGTQPDGGTVAPEDSSIIFTSPEDVPEATDESASVDGAAELDTVGPPDVPPDDVPQPECNTDTDCAVTNGTAACIEGECVVTCDPGWEGDLCDTEADGCLDNTECVNGTCVDEPDGFSCLCDEGWEGDLCDLDADDCVDNIECVNGTCVDELGGFSCVCNEGWEGALCDEEIPGIGDSACEDIEGAILVNTAEDALADDDLCSLREAIASANGDTAVGGCSSGGGEDVIALVGGTTYTLTLAGAGEDANQSGDLDLIANTHTTLVSCGDTMATIDAAQLDRVLHVHLGATLTLSGLWITGGVIQGDPGSITAGGLAGGWGGGALNEGSLSVSGCTFDGNTAKGGVGSDGSTTGGGGGGGGGAGLGGAIFNAGGELVVNAGDGDCVFNGNFAAGGRGGNGKGNGGSFSGDGGGGGGASGGDGGNAAAGLGASFGGGGGGGGGSSSSNTGGAGGFGGGGGGGGAKTGGGNTLAGGAPGFGGGEGGTGCCSAAGGAGGGAGLGGAIFVYGGSAEISGCLFSNNGASGGPGGKNHFGGPVKPGTGEGHGGALFTHSGEVTEANNIYEYNTADTGSPDTHTLDD